MLKRLPCSADLGIEITIFINWLDKYSEPGRAWLKSKTQKSQPSGYFPYTLKGTFQALRFDFKAIGIPWNSEEVSEKGQKGIVARVISVSANSKI
jgi:hypothetical protein